MKTAGDYYIKIWVLLYSVLLLLLLLHYLWPEERMQKDLQCPGTKFDDWYLVY